MDARPILFSAVYFSLSIFLQSYLLQFRLQGAEVVKVQEFKYLGTTVQSSGDCGREVKNRVEQLEKSIRSDR